MSKYAPEQLKEMALSLLQAQAQNDPRFIHWLMIMHGMTGMAPDLIQNRIHEYAGTYSQPAGEQSKQNGEHQ